MSPITRSVVERWRRLRAARASQLRDNVFAKVGDSVTVSGDYLYCFDKQRTQLEQHPHLLPTLQHFRAKTLEGRSSFGRDSVAAVIGWSAWNVIHGDPSPLSKELEFARPALALVQFGTNDIQIGAPHHFAFKFFEVLDTVLRTGAIPIVSTVMPRRDSTKAARAVPIYNVFIRGIAEARQVPLIDYHRELQPLPRDGLAKDGIHPATYSGKMGRDACDFSEPALQFGYNVKNLLTLKALHRVRAVLTDGPVEPGVAWRGEGTVESPLRVTKLPFTHFERYAAGESKWETYACPKAREAKGPETVYRLKVTKPGRYRIMQLDRGPFEYDLFLLGSADPNACIATHQRVIKRDLKAGEYLIVVDGVARAKAPNVDEFTPDGQLLTVTRESKR